MRLTEDRLLEVMPEINELQNPEWRSACISIWQDAFEQSPWEDIMDAPNNVVCPQDPLVRHTRGVLAATRALAGAISENQGVAIDWDKLLIITLIHDVCKIMEMEKDETGYHKNVTGERYPHGFFSGQLAMKYGLPDDVCASVLAHSQFIKNVPPCLEGVIMCYADLADADTVFFQNGKSLLLNYCKV